MKESAERTRNWVVICYPENSEDNWWYGLDELGSRYVRSPLHDRDVNADGTPKKPHWHLLLIFDGPKSGKQISSLLQSVGCNHALPIPALSVRGSVRYMAHKDNPEKAQYNENLIIFHGITKEETEIDGIIEEDDLISQMHDFIQKNQVRSFFQFHMWCQKNNYEWYSALNHKVAFIIEKDIKSFRYDLEEFKAGKYEGIPYWLETSDTK